MFVGLVRVIVEGWMNWIENYWKQKWKRNTLGQFIQFKIADVEECICNIYSVTKLFKKKQKHYNGYIYDFYVEILATVINL